MTNMFPKSYPTWPSRPSRLQLACAICLVDIVRAEDAATCYGGGTLALSIVVALILAAACIAAAYFFWTKYWKARKGQHLILETDPEKGEYAFDNPGFRDAGLTPVAKSAEKPTSKLESNLKTKWNQWSPLGALTLKNEKKRTMDDSDIENQVKHVSLRSHDFTGLGFNICGNMKEGIFVKDILHRGPAFESKKLNVGDRIQSVAISFEHMVFEDALAILSYASPYDIVISAKNGKAVTPGEVGRPQHPVCRSLSSTDLSQQHKKRHFDDSNDLETHCTNVSSNRNGAHAKVKNEQLQSAENKLHKFGVQVLPPLENSTKAQNTNNINHESEHGKISQSDRKLLPEAAHSIDEVDRQPPSVEKREKVQILQKHQNQQAQDVKHADETFQRSSSGIMRDKNGIPLELPSAMLNAAVAARKNRKSLDDDDMKSPKKKGKAPAPPEANTTDRDLPLKSDAKEYHSDSDGEVDNAGNQSSANTIELNASDITVHQSEDGADEKRKTASTGDLSKIQKARKTSTGTLERAQSLDITDTGIPALSSSKKRKAGRSDDFEAKTASDDSLYGSALVNKEPRLSLILDGLNTFQRSRLKKSTEWGHLEDAILNVEKQAASASGPSCTQEGIAMKSIDFASKTPEFDALVNKINEIKQETSNITNETSYIIEPDQMQPLMVDQLDAVISIEDEQMPQITEAIDKCELELDNLRDSLNMQAKNTIWPVELDTRQQKEEYDQVQYNDQERSIVAARKDNISIWNIPPPNGGDALGRSNEGVLDTTESKNAEQVFAAIVRTEHKVVDLNEKNHIHAEIVEMIAEAEQIASFLIAERNASLRYSPELNKLDDMNVPDDLKVIRHTFGSAMQSRHPAEVININASNVSNITINHKSTDALIDADRHTESVKSISVTTPDLIKNLAITEAIYDLNNEITIEGPTSLTLEVPSECSPTISTHCDDTKVEIKQQICSQMHPNGDIKKMEVIAADDHEKSQHSPAYVTEIQVSAPAKTTSIQRNNSEIETGPKSEDERLDSDFEQYIKNFESNIKSFESNIHHFEANIHSVAETMKSPEAASGNHNKTTSLVTIDAAKADPEKELKKVQDIVEEQLKKLPEMRFTTSSYESQIKQPEKRQSQIEILRSNFEKGASPPRYARSETSPPKSRIPVLNKTPPMSPERRDSRNMDTEQDKDILEIMASKYPHKNRNVTVTSIRSNSRIPSGLPTYGSRPPIPTKKNESVEDLSSSNGNAGSVETYRHWVFNPSDQSVTNVAVSEGHKHEHRK